VSERGGARDDEKARAEALFRYRLIAPLTDERDPAPLRARVAQIAAAFHVHPHRGETRVTARTLWKWLAAFRTGGIDALCPHERRDKGTVRAVSPEVLARAEALRREVPTRWTSTILDILLREDAIRADTAPHRATLDRHLFLRGASRRRLAVLGEKRTIKMHFDGFGDLWVGDYHHGPVVLGPDGGVVVAKLGAFIDHATRYPVCDRW
jgi:hypothetical protein